MLSLMFFFAIFAACRHTSQFNESLKKAYYRATKQHRNTILEKMEDCANMSVTTTKTEVKELKNTTMENKQKLEKEFIEYFSFGKYMELHQRVQYLENELDKQNLVKKRNPADPEMPSSFKDHHDKTADDFSADDDEDYLSFP